MLTVTVEIDAPAELGQGAKEAVAMRLEGLGGVRVLEVRETDGQMRMNMGPPSVGAGAFAGPKGQRVAEGGDPYGGANRPDGGAGQSPPPTKGQPMKSCFNCAARYGNAGLIEGKVAYGACRINRQPVRDLHGVCKQWSERR